jgi:hypothetical protein
MLQTHFCEKLLIVLFLMINRTIKNAFSEAIDLGGSSGNHVKVATVPAVPSGFSANLTDQAGQNDDSEP